MSVEKLMAEAYIARAETILRGVTTMEEWSRAYDAIVDEGNRLALPKTAKGDAAELLALKRHQLLQAMGAP